MKQPLKNPEVIRDKIVELTRASKNGRSICPSLVAKALESDERLWRRLLTPIRREAVEMAKEHAVIITRKGKPQDPYGEIKGILRLGPPTDDMIKFEAPPQEEKEEEQNS